MKIVVIVAVIVVVGLTAWALAAGGRTAMVSSRKLDAVKIRAELDHLESLKRPWSWSSLKHHRVGTVSIDGRDYAVYHDSKARMVYVFVQDKARMSAYLKDQSRIREDLDRYAQRLGITPTLGYYTGGDQELMAVVEEKPSPYDKRIEELERQFDLAIRQVEHKPLASNGQMHRILSDPNCRYFVVISPCNSAGPKNSELDAYVTKLAANKGGHWGMIKRESEPAPPNWLQPIRRIFRR